MQSSGFHGCLPYFDSVKTETFYTKNGTNYEFIFILLRLMEKEKNWSGGFTRAQLLHVEIWYSNEYIMLFPVRSE